MKHKLIQFGLLLLVILIIGVQAKIPGNELLPIPPDEECQKEIDFIQSYMKSWNKRQMFQTHGFLVEQLNIAKDASKSLAKRYAAFVMGREYAVKSGDIYFTAAFQEEFESTFKLVDPEKQWLMTLQSFRATNIDNEAQEHVCLAYLKQAERALLKRKFDFALLLAGVAAKVKTKDKVLKSFAKELATRIKLSKKYYSKLKKKKQYVDGHFKTLVLGDWDNSSQLLKGQNNKLGIMVQQDLAQPKSPELQIALSKKWQEFGHKLPKEEQFGANLRAVYWIQEAMITSGGNHEIEKKLVKYIENTLKQQLRRLRISAMLLFSLDYNRKGFHFHNAASYLGGHAQHKGGGAWVKDGKVKSALEFNPPNTHIVASIEVRHRIEGGRPRTMAMWIRTREDSQRLQYLIDYRSNIYNRAGQFTRFSLSGGKPRIDHGGDPVVGEKLINDGQWHHVVAVFSGSVANQSCTIYVDGVEVGQGKMEDDAWISGKNWLIGGNGDPKNQFVGELDEVAVFYQALSVSDIKLLYLWGMMGKGLSDVR